MKKVNLNGKLSFKKETIAKLNAEQMNVVKGGTLTDGCREKSSYANCYNTVSCGSNCNAASCMC